MTNKGNNMIFLVLNEHYGFLYLGFKMSHAPPVEHCRIIIGLRSTMEAIISPDKSENLVRFGPQVDTQTNILLFFCFDNNKNNDYMMI